MNALARPRCAGFGVVLAAVAGVRVVALDRSVLRAPEPPATCPTCNHAALYPCRDPNGEWTWCCVEGCNP